MDGQPGQGKEGGMISMVSNMYGLITLRVIYISNVPREQKTVNRQKRITYTASRIQVIQAVSATFSFVQFEKFDLDMEKKKGVAETSGREKRMKGEKHGTPIRLMRNQEETGRL